LDSKALSWQGSTPCQRFAEARSHSRKNNCQFIKVKPNAILISSEVGGFYKKPITRPGNTSAIGVSIELDYRFKILEIVEINFPIKGYGQRMVDAVLFDLPMDWQITIVFDHRNSF
jgi:hypothetical protein